MTPPTTRSSVFADDRTLGWSLYERLSDLFGEPILPLFQAANEADSLATTFSTRDPALFTREAASGLSSMFRQKTESFWPEPVRSALGRLERRRAEFVALLEPASRVLSTASRELEALNPPAGFWSALVGGAGQAANPSTRAGMGAVGGAILGSFLMPGVGTAIGGGLGALIGNSYSDKRLAAAGEKFDQAYQQFPAALLEMFGHIWDALVEEVSPAIRLPAWSFFADAERQWEQLAGTLTPEFHHFHSLRGYVEGFGPNPNALRVLFVGCLVHQWGGVDAATEWWKPQMTLFPWRAETVESNAELLLERGHWEAAIRAVGEGLRNHVGHVGLTAIRVEALGAAGRHAEAEQGAAELATKMGSISDAWHIYARGAIRAGETEQIVAAVRAWANADPSHPVIARLLRDDLPGQRFTTVAQQVSQLGPYTRGSLAEARAVTECFLQADNAKSWFGPPPADRLANARAQFLKVHTNEPILYFQDWSIWGDAKIGLALTPRWLLWRCTWQQAEQREFREVDAAAVKAEGTSLHVGDVSIDTGDANLASALVSTILELIALTKR